MLEDVTYIPTIPICQFCLNNFAKNKRKKNSSHFGDIFIQSLYKYSYKFLFIVLKILNLF